MGWLKRLAASDESLLLEEEADKQKRLDSWDSHMLNYAKREKLAKFFSQLCAYALKKEIRL